MMKRDALYAGSACLTLIVDQNKQLIFTNL